MSSTETADRNAIRKWGSLATLILFTTTTSMVSQRSRAKDPTGQTKTYSVATSVLLSELLKLGVSIGIAMYQAGATGNTTTATSDLERDLEDKQALLSAANDDDEEQQPPAAVSKVPTLAERSQSAFHSIYNASAWAMSVPALIYVVQNLLQLVANGHISAVAYQGLSQLKLVSAALIGVTLFGKTLNGRQWMCMPVLMLGVFFLSQRATPAAVTKTQERDQWMYMVGILAVLASCVCGSFAAVYIETRLKAHMSVPLAVRNAQLATFAACTASAALLAQGLQSESIWDWNPLEGFNTLAWLTVILRAAAGYVVSVTLRYADTIMKGFATSLAIVTTISLESVLAFSLPTPNQLVGAALVLFATYNYVTASISHK